MKNRKQILCISLFCISIIGGLSLTHRSANPSSNDAISVQEDGITLRMISETNTPEGWTEKRFSYKVVPCNATNQRVIASLKFEDGKDCSEVMTIRVDEEKKEIILICKKAFDKKIMGVISSEENPSVKAKITIDYVKKLLDIHAKTYSSSYFYFGGDCPLNNLSDFSVKSFVEPTYSIYTKDKNYTFAVKDVSVFFDEWNGPMDGTDYYDFCLNSDHIMEAVSELLEERILSGGKLITADELWNIDSEPGWHSYLAWVSENHYEAENNCYFRFSFRATYYCIENPSVEFSFNGTENDSYIYMSHNFDYSNKTIEVSAIHLDSATIEF